LSGFSSGTPGLFSVTTKVSVTDRKRPFENLVKTGDEWCGTPTYVPNIFFAQPQDYQKATISIEHGSSDASAVLLPVVPDSTAIQ
jgi:hypothetical protein